VTKADYGELMKEDGLDIEKMETKAREFTLSGDYRRMLARAGVCVALIEP
jgi:tRNA(Glu) U13 pseudouridine synthase TruD